MRRQFLTVTLMLLAFTGIASAHRLDEYLQATLITVAPDHIDVSMRLIPGVAVSSAVIASIDSNRDGVLSRAEQWAYAERVLGQLSLTSNGSPLQPKLVAADFPTLDQIRQGLGEIHIQYTAALPSAAGPERRLVLESQSQNQKAVYLVNVLAPTDSRISITAQKRNQLQSFYELDYTQSDTAADPSLPQLWSGMLDQMRALGLSNLFQLGLRHIAEGTDHLLFLLVLLLPAPLIAVGSRWAGTAGVRESLLHILGIVSAFTVGHSITLALAAFGVVHVPSHPVEVLIAVSILVSAVHAFKPIFPGKEAAIAAFFGLIHGLAFASTLSDLGLGRWQRLAGILSFNLGIETMQMAVVAAILPSLLLLSRTRVYPILRTAGALFAAIASIGWIVERLLGLDSAVDLVVNSVAHAGGWIAISLFVLSLVCWYAESASQTAVLTPAAPARPAASASTPS